MHAFILMPSLSLTPEFHDVLILAIRYYVIIRRFKSR